MTFQPPYRPSGRSVWLGKDLVATDDWIVRLSPATLAEIDASVTRLRGRNAYDSPVTRDEFPLITMAQDLARMRHEIATGRGFFVFRGLDRDRSSDNELGLIFRGFGGIRPRADAKRVRRPPGRYPRHQRYSGRPQQAARLSVRRLPDRAHRPERGARHRRYAQPEDGEVGRRKPDRQRPHRP